MDFEPITLYTEIDSIFDTRLAVLQSMGYDPFDIAQDIRYFDRVSEEFEGVDSLAFKEAYSKRDRSIMPYVMISQSVYVMIDFITDTLRALISSPLRKQPKIFINTYPYRLEDKEIENIIFGLSMVTRRMADIEAGYISYEDLTPKHCKSTYAQMLMYNSSTWLDIHAENKNIIETPCPQLTLFAPELYKSRKAFEEQTINPRKAIEDHASFFIKLRLLPVITFCIDMNRGIRSAKPT